MARGRMLNKKISRNKAVAELIHDVGPYGGLFFTWLISHLDKEGRAHGDPDVLKGEVVPRIAGCDPDVIRKTTVKAHELGLIELYEVEGEVYLQFCKFAENQAGLRANREPKSDFPSPAGRLSEDCRKIVGNVPPEEKRKRTQENINLTQEKGREGNAPSCLWPNMIASTADFEAAVADWGWSIQLSSKDRARVQRLTDADPITQEEYQYAQEQANDKDHHQAAYFLGVVEGQRKDAANEKQKGIGPPAAKRLAAMSRKDRDLQSLYDGVEDYNEQIRRGEISGK